MKQIPLQFVLVCFLILGLSVLAGAYFLQTTEGFQTLKPRDSDIQLQACPSGTENFTKKNEVLCCRGDIVNGECNGTTVCSLTNSGQFQFPSCLRLLKQSLNKKSVQFCPPSLPNYFEDLKTGQKGCTSGERTVDGTKPKSTSAARCRVYQTEQDSLTKPDSCRVLRNRDKAVCPGGGRPQVSTTPETSGVIQCTYSVPRTLVPRTCFEDASFKEYLQFKKRPMLNDRDFKLSFCSVAKRYYLDKSLTDAMLNTLKL